MVAFAELRARAVRHDQRGELDVSRGANDVARFAGRGRDRSVANDAGNRWLLDRRDGRAHGACDKARLRWYADAAAVLLQERQRRRSLPSVQRSGATRRRCASANLPLPYSAGGDCRYHTKIGRASPESLSDRDRRDERQLWRLE